jgi:cephalosporin-C deacetylase
VNHDFPFDPSHGYDREQLLAVGPPPAPRDFEPFWRATYAAAAAVPPHVTRREIPSPHMAFKFEEIEFDAWGDRRIGGWMLTPRDAPPRRWVVNGHGYVSPDVPTAADCRDGEATLSICCRGFGRSRSPDIPDVAVRHVVHGIADRESYIHRGCTADIWAAASAVLALFPPAAGRLGYRGGSFGGGIGAMALAWDDRFSAAALDMPSFGHHPLRLQCPCVGSGKAVRAAVAGSPGLRQVLAYYDAAVAARFIRAPTLVSPALFDPAVPPPGQFPVYNAISGEKSLFVRTVAHFDAWAGAEAEHAECRRRQDAWLASRLG